MSLPKYGRPGFYRECWYLSELPRTSADAYRQLHALGEIQRNDPRITNRNSLHLSRRRLRVLRTYWALLRAEQKGA